LDLSRVRKKLAEADFFLAKMTKQEQRPLGDRERFEYYLSAFLNAARTVDYRLCHEQEPIYKPWREAWNAHLSPEENGLIKNMIDDRNLEVHESGSRRSVGQEDIDYTRPMVRSGRSFGGENLVAHKATFSLTINGTDRRATEACREYLDLLRPMVAEFEDAHP